jgi:AMIN domain-containing protein
MRIFGRRAARLALAVAASALVAVAGRPLGAAPLDVATITGVTTTAEGHDLLVIVHASGPVHFVVQPVRPEWIVVDLSNARLGVPAGTAHGTEGLVDRVRLGQFSPTVVRVVVECPFAVHFDVTAAEDGNGVVVAIPNGVERPAGLRPPSGGGSPPATGGAPGPSSAPTAQAGASTIVPGRSIGAVRLGMTLRDVVAAIGQAKDKVERPGVGVDYTWYAAPAGSGVGVRLTDAGTVRQIWVVNDGTYRTAGGLHTGSTETEVKAALGAPSWTIAVASSDKSTTLMYDALGVWFTVRSSPTAPSQNVVYRIDVLVASR